MKAEFKVNITAKDMFCFLINNAYRKFTGVIWVLFSIVVVGVIIYTWGDVHPANTVVLIITASLYTVINPIILWLRARAQIKRNDCFNNELLYSVNDKGITVSQGEETATVKWDEMWKAVKYGQLVVVYVTTIRAFILPIRCIGEQYNTLVELAHNGLPARCHLRKKKTI